MSYLPGQRLSACTCASESDGSDGRQMVHPGPKRADGSYVGRSAPEIDVFEAAVDTTTLIGHVSQSGQWQVETMRMCAMIILPSFQGSFQR
jgi:hypothetical protein